MTSNLILIFENLTGHRTSFINEIIGQISSDKINIEILYLSKKSLSEFRKDNSKTIYIPFKSRMQLLDYVKIKQNANNSTEVYFMDFDRWIFHVFLFQKIEFKAIILRPYLQKYSVTSICRYLIKNILLFFASVRYRDKIFRLSIPMQNHFFPKRWVTEIPVERFSRQVHFIPDIFNLRTRIYTFLVIGAISQRKGLNEALRLIEKFVAITDSSAIFRIVGLQDAIDTNFPTKNNKIEIITINRYLDDSEYFEELLNTDFLIAFNSNVGSSRTILEGIAAGKIVLTNSLSKHWKEFQKANWKTLIKTDDFLKILRKDRSAKLFEFTDQVSPFSKFKSEVKSNWLEVLFPRKSDC